MRQAAAGKRLLPASPGANWPAPEPTLRWTRQSSFSITAPHAVAAKAHQALAGSSETASSRRLWDLPCILRQPSPRSAPSPARDAQVAQLVEHATENRSVGGSIPPLGTNFLPYHILKQLTRCTLRDRGRYRPPAAWLGAGSIMDCVPSRSCLRGRSIWHFRQQGAIRGRRPSRSAIAGRQEKQLALILPLKPATAGMGGERNGV